MAVAMGARTCGPGATPIGRSPPGRPVRCCLREPRAPERGYRKPGPKSPSPTQHSCGFQGPVRLVQKTRVIWALAREIREKRMIRIGILGAARVAPMAVVEPAARRDDV